MPNYLILNFLNLCKRLSHSVNIKDKLAHRFKGISYSTTRTLNLKQLRFNLSSGADRRDVKLLNPEKNNNKLSKIEINKFQTIEK